MITQEETRELIDYDPCTGTAVWRARPNMPTRQKPGAEIGGLTKPKRGAVYRTAFIRGKRYLCHRLFWLYVHGELPPQIDHINRNTLDNRIKNLRAADNSLNSRNRGVSRNNKSGVKGVSEVKTGWVARISNRHVGHFKSFDAAVAARKKAEIVEGY